MLFLMNIILLPKLLLVKTKAILIGNSIMGCFAVRLANALHIIREAEFIMIYKLMSQVLIKAKHSVKITLVLVIPTTNN